MTNTSAKTKRPRRPGMTLETISWGALAVAVVMLCAVGGHTVRVVPGGGASAGTVTADTAEAAGAMAAEDILPPPWTGRDLFRAPTALTDIPAAEPAPAPVAVTSSWGQNYKLVGMLVGRAPAAVMENKTNSETHFLSVGDTLDGAVLEAVDADGAVFSYQGQQRRLRFETGRQ